LRPIALDRLKRRFYTPAPISGNAVFSSRFPVPGLISQADSRAAARYAARGTVLIALAALSVLSTGCVRRRLTVRTFPPGAQVFVDDQEIGTTPCSASFVYYGTRKITIMKDGYRTETLFQTLNPPWYQIPPLDFVTENLVPREIRDERVVDLQLVPQESVSQEKLVERAQVLRDSATAGFVTPLLNLPPGSEAVRAQEAKLGVPGDGLPGGQPLPYDPLPAPGAPPPQAGALPLSAPSMLP
jgi:hypothetical protein